MYEGRGWDTEGAHTYGYNSVSIGIAFIGEFSYRKPHNAALSAAKQLISYGVSTVVACFYAALPPELHTELFVRLSVQSEPFKCNSKTKSINQSTQSIKT